MSTYRTEDWHRFTREWAEAKAAYHGCEIEVSDPRTLLLDLDSPESVERFLSQLTLAHSIGFEIESAEISSSKSGNTHARVRLGRDYPLVERILLQACLGSDLRRELLTFRGLQEGQEDPCLLFRPKGQKWNAVGLDQWYGYR